MLLHGIYNYTVQVRTVQGTMPHLGLYTTTQYRRLHGTWNYAVHGTTQYMGLLITADYTVQVRKVHGTMPHRDSAIQCINDYAWISYPGQVNNWCNVEVRVKSYFLFGSPDSGRTIGKTRGQTIADNQLRRCLESTINSTICCLLLVCLLFVPVVCPTITVGTFSLKFWIKFYLKKII